MERGRRTLLRLLVDMLRCGPHSPRSPSLDSTTKNIQTQGNGFGTFLQKFQTVRLIS